MATVLEQGLKRDEPTELQAVGRRRGPNAERLLMYLVLILIALFFILPLVVLVSTTLKYKAEIVQDTGLIPLNPGLENYQQLFSGGINFFKAFLNSAIVAMVGTVLTVALTSLSAYAFARIDFPFKGAIFSLLITTLLLPGVMFLVPQAKLIGQVGLYDTLPAFILPGLAGVFGVFFMRQFFLGIPVELEESAYVDGAGRFRTFFSVVLPLAGPSLATLAVITFIGYWNDYLWPLVTCQGGGCTLSPGLRNFQGTYSTQFGLLMAGAVLAAVPVLVLYVFAQRYIVQSVTSSGIKG